VRGALAPRPVLACPVPIPLSATMAPKAVALGRRSQSKVMLPLAAAAIALAPLVPGLAPRAFVPPPRAATPAPALALDGAAVGGALAGLVAPAAVRAELPPLEELPLEDIKDMYRVVRKDTTFFGIDYPFILLGLVGVVLWAAFVVVTFKPKKDADGVYKTYFGGGELPPEGYTNPLDPRVDEAYTEREDPIYKEKPKIPREKQASTALI